jgi:hypothetical protein
MKRLEIPERRGQEIVAKIADRDQYAQTAQQILNAKNETIEAIIQGQLQAAGHDPDALRGQVQCQRERDGKYVLTIQDAQAQPGGMQMVDGQQSIPASLPPNGSTN